MIVTCSCGHSTLFRDDYDGGRVCVFCGSRLDRLPDPPPPSPPPPPLPDRPAELYIVQAFIIVYVVATGFLARAIIDGLRDEDALSRVVAGVVVVELVWASMFFGLQRRAAWASRLSVGVFTLLISLGAAFAVRMFLFSRAGDFRPQNASVFGAGCAAAILALATVSFGVPLMLLAACWRRL
mgnify:CR=1 FL=1